MHNPLKNSEPLRLSLGISPCPNDTFIFDALLNNRIDTQGIIFDYVLEDVETLNQWAPESKLDITKLSYSTILQATHRYALLDAGSALGHGVGPLLIQKEKTTRSEQELRDYLSHAKIAIPGRRTTANLLFTLAFPEARHKTEVLFSDIEEKVTDGTFDCGLVIHESRFTYAERGLHKIMDMGEWWEQTSGSAIPLGGICIKRDIHPDTARKVNSLIVQSLQYSWNNYPQLAGFVTRNAQEMSEDVMRQHIELYVNDYSLTLGESGRQAISTLFAKAKEAGLTDDMPDDLYI